MYTSINYRSKKEIKDAIKKDGHAGTVFQPGMGAPPPENGTVTLEGPHYPEPHKWYTQATLKNGLIVKIK